jgi:hypothetical protein
VRREALDELKIDLRRDLGRERNGHVIPRQRHGEPIRT